jgi:hypothetical protein
LTESPCSANADWPAASVVVSTFWTIEVETAAAPDDGVAVTPLHDAWTSGILAGLAVTGLLLNAPLDDTGVLAVASGVWVVRE